MLPGELGGHSQLAGDGKPAGPWSHFWNAVRELDRLGEDLTILDREVALPDKVAALSACTRADFAASRRAGVAVLLAAAACPAARAANFAGSARSGTYDVNSTSAFPACPAASGSDASATEYWIDIR